MSDEVEIQRFFSEEKCKFCKECIGYYVSVYSGHEEQWLGFKAGESAHFHCYIRYVMKDVDVK